MKCQANAMISYTVLWEIIGTNLFGALGAAYLGPTLLGSFTHLFLLLDVKKTRA